MKSRVAAVLLCLMTALCCAGCSLFQEAPKEVIPNPILTIELEDGLSMRAELYYDVAPNTVANIVTLVESGYYDGLTFHRVVPGFLIQTGDPTATGTGGPGYTIKGEFAENGFPNSLSHERGVLSMARRPSDYDSAGGQFFIVQVSAPALDGAWAAFGKLLDQASFDALDTIASTPTDVGGKPLYDRVIRRMTVDTHDYQYEVVKND